MFSMLAFAGVHGATISSSWPYQGGKCPTPIQRRTLRRAENRQPVSCVFVQRKFLQINGLRIMPDFVKKNTNSLSGQLTPPMPSVRIGRH
jgi:hypothetical protein